MRQRAFVATGVLAVVCTVMSTSVTGQAPANSGKKVTEAKPAGGKLPEKGKAEAAVALDRARQPVPKNWVAPKTSWGDPDLQGTWSYATTTPLNRPASAGEKAQLSQAELAALAAAQAGREDAPPRPGDTGTYNAFWFDRGAPIERTSLVVDPPNGRVPPLTPEAKNIKAGRLGDGTQPPDSYLDLDATLRCIMYHGVPPLPSGYNNTYQIFQTPTMVAILDEDIHHVRLVPMDNSPHLTSAVRHWNGDSRGHWEGNTLVIETTNFSDKSELRYGGSMNTTSVERFTRNGPYSIDYRYTITDPKVFTKPFTVGLPMALRDDAIYEYACHEGNYAIAGILAAARLREKEAAVKAK